MSTTMITRVCKYDEKDNLFHELALYKIRNKSWEQYEYDEEGHSVKAKDPYIKISLFEGTNSEMFDGMRHGTKEDGYGDFPMHYLRFGSLEPSFAADIQEAIKKGCYDVNEINLAEFKLYCRTHRFVTDYDREDAKGEYSYVKKNPLESLYEKVCAYCSLVDDIDFDIDPLSDYKVIFYFC